YATHDSWWARGLALALAYGGVYAYGLMSVTVFAAAVRALAEHQIGDDETCARRGEAAMRNLHCNALTRLLFGAYGFELHATHHQRPGVPYYQLPELTKSLLPSDPTLAIGPGYIGRLIRLTSSRSPPRPEIARS